MRISELYDENAPYKLPKEQIEFEEPEKELLKTKSENFSERETQSKMDEKV